MIIFNVFYIVRNPGHHSHKTWLKSCDTAATAAEFCKSHAHLAKADIEHYVVTETVLLSAAPHEFCISQPRT